MLAGRVLVKAAVSVTAGPAWRGPTGARPIAQVIDACPERPRSNQAMPVSEINHADHWRQIPAEVETVRLGLAAAARPVFLPLLQEGVWLRCRLGATVRQVLCEQLGIAPAYVSERISTLFLNGHPVDDPATVRVQAGDTLALSAAMPGLVGAVMRCGGYFAGLRNSITCRPSPAPECREAGYIKVKMFNKIMVELGPDLLASGIYLRASRIGRLLTEEQQRSALCESPGRPPGEPLALPRLLDRAPDRWLFWQISFRA